MSTNYYWQGKEFVPCPRCGNPSPPDPIHIGLSAVGWCFKLQVIPELNIHDLSDWKRKWQEPGEIKDQYGRILTPAQMSALIEERKGGGPLPAYSWLVDNGAVVGPNGLVRERLSHHCIGHGEGTWDLIEGEFS